MPDAAANIFLTKENLAFSMPLILVVTVYVYFKFLPLHIALPILGLLVILFQIRSQILARREKKLEKLDENAIQDIVGEFEDENSKDKEKEAAEAERKKQKAKNKVQQRLAQERKAEARKAANNSSKKKNKGKGGGGGDEEDDDEEDLAVFAKGSRDTKKKK